MQTGDKGLILLYPDKIAGQKKAIGADGKKDIEKRHWNNN